MKNRMPTRKSIGKVSTYLQSQRRKHNSSTDNRRDMRGTHIWPNSSKIGAGVEVKARRNLSIAILHKRNHRSNKLIKAGF